MASYVVHEERSDWFTARDASDWFTARYEVCNTDR